MICRLCLTETEFYLPLKKSEIHEDEETEDVGAVLRKHFHLPFNISSDVVCTVCWQQINEFHKYYLFIEEKQKERNDESQHAIVFTKTASEFLKDNIPMVTENSLNRWKPKEATENFEDIQIVEKNATLTDMKIWDRDNTSDDDVVEIKNETLKEMGSPMLMASNLSPWYKVANLQEESENLENKENYEFIDLVDSEASNCETSGNEVSKNGALKTETTPYTIPNVLKQLLLDGKLRRERSDLIIAEHAGILKCDLCAQPLENFDNLIQHFNDEHRRRGYVLCCNQEYVCRHYYADHLEWHLNPNLWKCQPCDQNYASQVSYEVHLSMFHSMEENLKFLCKFCSAKFSQHYLLDQHLRDHEKYLKCDQCHREFKSYTNLKSHKKSVHLAFYKTACDICGKIFSTPAKCKMHKANIHDVARSFDHRCSHCSERFASRTELNKHKEQRHSEYACSYKKCNKKFKSFLALNDHRIQAHQSNPGKMCDICGKFFNSMRACKIHKTLFHKVERDFINY